MSQEIVALATWTLATLVGTIVGLLALREIQRNHDAAKYALDRHRPYARAFLEITRANFWQQIGRLAMEVVCWASVAVVLFGNPDWRGAVVTWLLVSYRLMHMGNSLTEYIGNQRRRQRMVKT